MVHAGGGRLNARLGDVVITNAALLDLQRPQNVSDPDNGAMFRCQTWYPATALKTEVEENLLYRLKDLLTPAALTALFAELRLRDADDPGQYTLEDVLNRSDPAG